MEGMQKIASKIRQSAFLRHNAVLFAGSVAVGALNYLYYPVLGRLLPPAAFGEVQTLVSLFLQMITFLMVLSLVTINVVANYTDTTRRNHVILELEKVGLGLALLMLLASVVWGEQLRQFLQFDSQWPFAILAAAVVMTVPFTSRTAFLRGMRRFGASAIANMIGAGGKVLLSALLVLAGLGTSGAIGGLALAQAAAYGYAAWQAGTLGFTRPAGFKKMAMPRLNAIMPELRYALFVLLGSLGVMVLFSIDIIVVKRFFDAHTAGLYAGISAVARIIFFLTASVSQVLMPSVKLSNPGTANRQLFIKSAALLCGVSLPVLAVCALAPEFVVSALMGQNYAAHATLLPALSLATFGMSLLNLVVLYFLALHRFVPAVLAMAGALVTGGALAAYHDSLGTVVMVVLGGSFGALIAIALWAGLDARRRTSA